MRLNLATVVLIACLSFARNSIVAAEPVPTIVGRTSTAEGVAATQKLDLRRIDISAADVESLKASLPAIAIDWKPLTDEERTKLESFLK